MNLAMVGTGYLGLVTGMCIAESGNHVICVVYEPEQMTREGASYYSIGRPGVEAEESAVDSDAQFARTLAENPMW